tara:strand:- start:259 stop:885 length:627 start_codon:yes stop_codon:yes gene_type:complete
MNKIFYFFVVITALASASSHADENFSSRKKFNDLMNGFYKNEIFKCDYVNKSWSIGFEDFPYGLVNNGSAFKNILVFSHKRMIGTLWPNIGEISIDRGVRKYQIWDKTTMDEFVLINSGHLSDKNSGDINFDQQVIGYKTYFDQKSLKIAVKSWITDFYKCEEIDSSNFARKKLIDIFVNQDEYVKKDFSYREKNPNLFDSKIELIPN